MKKFYLELLSKYKGNEKETFERLMEESLIGYSFWKRILLKSYCRYKFNQ